MIRAGDVLDQQLLEDSDLAVARSGPDDSVDLTGRLVEKLGAVNMILRDDVFQRRINHLDGSGGENVEVEEVAIHAGFEDLVKQFDVPFEADALAYLVEMFFADLGFELRVVEQEIGELRTLLHEVDLRHSFRFAFKLRGGNADQLGEHVTGIIEGEGLVEVARENIAF